MKTTRRDILKFAGGSALGALLTPAPWRLVTDTALWSENWPGIPRPARGEIRAKFTHCPLCPAGCAVRARCVGEQPISLAGVRGGLCPYGVTAHHLPYHPARLKQGAAGEATAAVADAIARRRPGEHVAVLDPRPGRTASWTARRAMAAIPDGLYIAPAESPVAVDLANAKTILSLGAPLFDRWGTPANVFAARDGFRLIQAEAVESPTAALADRWIPIPPGSENAVSESLLASLSKELAKGPALVVGRTMSPAIVALNIKLGGWGRTIVPRAAAPVPREWQKSAPVANLADVPDRSIRVLLIDESTPGEYLPWDSIERKLVADNPLVVTFAWSANGYGSHARYVLPTAIYPEALDDIPATIDSPAPVFRIATPLVPAPEAVVNPTEFISALAGLPPSDALRSRADAIHAAGRGTLATYDDAKRVPIKDVSADDFWKALNQGACWIGERAPAGPAPPIHSLGLPLHSLGLPPASPEPVALATGAPALPLVSPLFTKLYQESGLLLAPDRIALHPRDAARSGLSAGTRASLETAAGKFPVTVTTDSSVRPGVILTPRAGLAGAPAKVVRL